MQGYTAAPRQALSATTVRHLLTTASSVEIEGGVEVLDHAMDFVADLSGNLQPGSSITSDCLAAIHRSCSLVMDADAPLNYLNQYVKPYMVMTDTNTGFTARFNLGIFQLSSPAPDLAAGRSVYTGYDLLQSLNKPIGNTFEYSGTDPVTAASTLITAACPPAMMSFEPVSVGGLPAFSWPLDSSNQFTYLAVVNALLAVVGYAPVWVDWDGVFHMHQFVNPNDPEGALEWAFDLSTATESTTAEGRSIYQDLYGVPNTWIYVMSNLEEAPVEGVTQFTYADYSSPSTGIAARQHVVKKVVFVDVADFASLVLAAAQGIELDLSPTEAFAVRVFPNPLFWHRDTALYTDPALSGLSPLNAGSRRVLVKEWTLPLDVEGGDMSLTLITMSSVVSAAMALG